MNIFEYYKRKRYQGYKAQMEQSKAYKGFCKMSGDVFNAAGTVYVKEGVIKNVHIGSMTEGMLLVRKIKNPQNPSFGLLIFRR